MTKNGLENMESLLNLYELSVSDFSKELSSKSPAPGGGSTAALAGALACSLVGMVSKITLKKSEKPDTNIILKRLIDDSESTRCEFLILINDDTEAFNEILKSFKLPKNSEAEKQVRLNAIQKATKHATNLPLKTARLGLKTMEWVKELAEIGAVNAITDTGVAGLLAYSAVRGAIWNVKINLGSIKDSGFVQETNFEIEKILNSLNSTWKDIQTRVEDKILQ